MHTIQIPDAKFEKLSEQATAAGFEDVVAYIEALANEADFDPRCGMSDEELRQSAAQCNSINERMKAGAERNAREALTELGDQFGFSSPL
jgi:hypothetical protein